MNTITAVVVDDEQESRDGLRRIVPWEQFGISVILEAAHGKQGLELIAQYRPDVVFTDLVMPHMDGLELMRELQRMRIGSRIVVITGHDDFAYAREALRLGACDYILKPFRTHEVLPAIARCTDEIQLERLARSKHSDEKEKYKEALRLLQEKTVEDIIAGTGDDIRRLKPRLEPLHLDWMLQHPLAVATIEIDNIQTLLGRQADKERDLLLFAIGNVTSDSISGQLPYFLYRSPLNRWVAVLGAADRFRVRALAETLIANMNRYVKLSVSIGIGQPVTLDELPLSYATSVEALGYKAILGGNQVLDSRDVLLSLPRQAGRATPTEQEILTRLKTGAEGQTDEIRRHLVAVVQSWGNLTKDELHQSLFEWLLKIERQLKSGNESLDVLTGHTLKSWTLFVRYDTFEGILDCAMRWIGQMAEQNRSVRHNRLGQIAGKALQIIAREFDKDITLGQVADKVYVSPVWLSHLLKEKTGKTFLEIVTDHRIGRAKELLSDVALKAYEVAEKVGYRDTDYFYRQFKRYTGMTPTQYRNSIDV